MSNGSPIRPEDQNKYTENKGISSFTLTLHNTVKADGGDYRCGNNFEESASERLNIECKASSATQSVSSGKKIQITVDKLYPVSITFNVTFERQNSAIQISGSRTCSGSSQYSGYYRCVWSSSNSIDDGSYTYNVVVTTITQASPLKGSFKIVSPGSPLISNIVQLNASREVLYGNEGQSLTIQCSSSGGYPVPTVTWYKESKSNSNQLATTSSGILQSDGTYTVSLQHTFTPVPSDDRKDLLCRSYYPQADSAQIGSNSKSVLLYLILKPSQPTVTQTSVVSAGNDVTVRCRTTECRPAASISWLYRGVRYNGSTTSTLDATTETFTVISMYTRQVTAEDNGQRIQCIVTHPALVSPQEFTESINLDVQFHASTIQISGNKETIATGSTPLTLTCTTGSSNPVSDITWKNGSNTLDSDRSYKISSGDNNGAVRSQQLVLYSTRYMDGNEITCSVSNTVSQSPVVDKVKLNLKYFPVVIIQGEQQYTLTEGENKQFTCKVESKPLSTIKWYHGNSLIFQGSPSSNVFSLSLSPVNRTNYGSYSCRADNGIGTEHQDQISITIRFKPLTTTITGNSNIIANGRTILTLDCTSGSSNPISDITWKINNVITTATKNSSDQNGEYGGKKRRQRLILTPTRDDDGDIILCEAKNTLGTSNKHEETLDLRYRPLINNLANVTVTEGNHSILECSATSKPASTFKWYKYGQSSNVLHQGTGTLDNNKLSYRINNVRRSDAATYTCNANNGIENTDNKNVLLTVYHPPVVTVTTTNTTVKADTAIITCNAKGVPDNNYKYGKWIHTWPGRSIPLSARAGTEILKFTDLTYEYSGVYTCSASNGIVVFGTNKEFIEGSSCILIKSFPIITKFNENVAAKLKEKLNFEIEYYSNTGESDVKVFKNVNGSRQNVPGYLLSKTSKFIDLPVFTQTIKTTGTKAVVSFTILSKEDMGYYEIIVSNEVDSTIRSFEIDPKGPPDVPYNITVDSIQQTTVRVSWQQGYHGGYDQTFLIQLSNDKIQWENVENVFGGRDESREPKYKKLKDLKHSTTYFVRIYSFNEDGNSPFSQNQNFTTLPLTGSPAGSSTVGGIVGGTVTAVVVVSLVVVIVVLVRRKTITKDGIRTRFQTLFSIISRQNRPEQQCQQSEMEIYPEDNDTYEQSNASAQNRPDAKNNPINLYEKLQRHSSENRKAYDIIKVQKEEAVIASKTDYENLPKKLCSIEEIRSKIEGKLSEENPRIYENLKTGVKMTRKK